MRLEKMRERAKAFQSGSSNAAHAPSSSSSFRGQNYSSVWEEYDAEMRNDDHRHSMGGGMYGQQRGYGGFEQQGQDDPMTFSPFGGQENI